MHNKGEVQNPLTIREIVREHSRALIVFSSISLILLVAGIILIFILKVSLEIKHFALLIELFGLLTGALAAYMAAKAELKASKTLRELEEASLIVKEISDNFSKIFQQHLLAPLEDLGQISRAWLLLSTPAYGFPVLGNSPEFKKLVDRFGKLCANGKLELIVFSPDAHFYHLANVLLWWRAVPFDKDESSLHSPLLFASSIKQMLDYIKPGLEFGSPHDWKVRLWTTNETTIRIFAFKYTSGYIALPMRMYVSFSDRVTLSSPQWEIGAGEERKSKSGFRGRGLPMLQAAHGHLVSDTDVEADSYFDQVKRCQYKMTTGLKARVQKWEISALTTDYLLLRTHQKLFDFRCFRDEVDLMLTEITRMSQYYLVSTERIEKSENVKEAEKSGTIATIPMPQSLSPELHILECILGNVLMYFEHMVTFSENLRTSCGGCAIANEGVMIIASEITFGQAACIWLGICVLKGLENLEWINLKKCNNVGPDVLTSVQSWLTTPPKDFTSPEKITGFPGRLDSDNAPDSKLDLLLLQLQKTLARLKEDEKVRIIHRFEDLWHEGREVGNQDVEKLKYALYCFIASGLTESQFRVRGA